MYHQTRLVATLAIVLVSAEGRAQASDSYAKITDSQTLTNPCGPVFFTNQPGSATSSCPLMPISGGDAFALGTTSNALRTARGAASMVQTGPAGSMTGLANASGTLHSAVSLAGTSSIGDQLVFHIAATTPAQVAVGNPAGTPSHSFYEAYLSGFTNNALFTSLLYPAAYGGVPQLSGSFYTITGTGLDFRVGFGGYTGSTSYTLLAYAEAYVESAGRTDAQASADIALQVAGIDWVDAHDSLLGTASFLSDGTAVLTSVTTTPEPTSVALLASGLVLLLVGAPRLARSRL